MKDIIKKLHPLERKLLQFLTSEFKSVKELSKEANLEEVSVLRAAGWLKEKGLAEIKEEIKEILIPTAKGLEYRDKELPELRLLNILKEKKEVYAEDVKDKFSPEEFSIALGTLKRKNAIVISKEKGKLKLILVKEIDIPEDKVLKKIIKGEELSLEERALIPELIKRGLIKREIIKEYYVRATEEGLKVKDQLGKIEFIEVLTRDIIVKKEWKGKEFREFDIKTPVEPYKLGKKHPYLKFLEYVRKILLSMGFEEMEGPIVLSSFWNCDALFMPQDHPSREIHDIFFLKEPRFLEDFPKELFEKVKQEHLKYWKFWKDDIAKRAILRSQVTALSALTLRKVKIPGKYFAIERVFRPDTIDAKHFIEFRQLEGIVLDESITFRDLLGLLKELSKEVLGIEKVKFYPAYFPFTEPSVELYVKHPKLGWIEIGGAGLFREELLRPFGIKVPVIAWGLGIDRMAMIALGIDDIRLLWAKDINWLKEKEIPFI